MTVMKFRPGQLIRHLRGVRRIIGYEPEPMKTYMSLWPTNPDVSYLGDIIEFGGAPVLFLGIAHEPIRTNYGTSGRWIEVLCGDRVLVVDESIFEAL